MTDQKSPFYVFWQELDPKKTSAQIVREALAYAKNKHGQAPTLVRVPLNFPDLNGDTPEGVTIERHKDVAPTYLWVQVPEKPQADQPIEPVQE